MQVIVIRAEKGVLSRTDRAVRSCLVVFVDSNHFVMEHRQALFRSIIGLRQQILRLE